MTSVSRPSAATTLGLACSLGFLGGVLDWAMLAAKVAIEKHRFPFELPLDYALKTIAAAVALGLIAGFPLSIVQHLTKRKLARGLVLGILLTLAVASPLHRLALKPWACWLLAAGIGSQLAFVLLKRERLEKMLLRQLLPAIALGLAAFWIGSNAWARVERIRIARPPAEAGAPNVLFIVMDTVRKDAIDFSPGGRTPAIAALADRGARFDNAYSAAPWTLPSIASMLTGEWPHRLSCGIEKPLDEKPRTLAEALASRGYETAGFAANGYYLGERSGLARGFREYTAYPLSLREVLRNSKLWRDLFTLAHDVFGIEDFGDYESLWKTHSARAIRGELARLLDTRDRARPFFAFINVFEAHTPYLPPPDPSATGRGLPAAGAKLLREWNLIDKSKLNRARLTMAKRAYADCVAAIDRELGGMLEDLAVRKLLDNTIVIVTSDHGEHFGEHGLFGHGCSLFDELIRVPLVIAGPGVPRGKRVTARASLKDLAATVVGFAGGVPGTEMPGSSLKRFWKSNLEPAGEPLIAQVQRARWDVAVNQGRSENYAGALIAIIYDRFKLILDSRDRAKLFDLSSDPAEAHDLSGELDRKVLELRGKLEELLSPPDRLR